MADTAALVVALSAQLTKFEKDMQQATQIAKKRTEEIEGTFAKMNQNINNQFSSFASGAAARLGPVGSALAALGPVGLTVAAALGVLAGAFLFVSNEVDKFTEKAKGLKDTAETTGLTINQLKALGTAGREVGLDFEQTEKFVTRMTLAVQDLRNNGSGPLFEALVKINPQLVRQIAGAKDVAAAIGILSSAYKGLNDQLEKNALVASIAGKRNIAGGRLLEALPEGGLDKLEADAKAAGKSVDENLINKVVELRRQIDEIKKRTDNLWGAAFSSDVLAAEKASAEYWERISKALIDAYQQARSGNLIFRGATPEGAAAGKPAEPTPNQQVAARFGVSTMDEAAAAREARSKTLVVDLELMKRWTSVLGDALTQSEALKQKELELAVAVDKGGVSRDQATRALSAFQLQQQQLAESTRERLGVATEEQIVQARLNQLYADAAKYGLSANEVLQASTLILREAKTAADALTVRQAYLPGLKQLELDAANLRKGIDELATRSLETLTDGFADVIVGTKSLADAFKSMTDSILRDIVRIALRQAIIAPLAGALGGFAGGGVGGGGPLLGRQGGGPVRSGQPYIVGEHGPELFVPSTSGSVIPNQVASSGGTGSTTVEVNNYVAADTETRQTRQNGPDGERIVVDIVKKAQARGEFDDVNRGRFGIRPEKVR